MKKYIIIALTAIATLTVSCNKQIEPEQNIDRDSAVSIVKSFKVVMPETKAYLDENETSGKKLVSFSDGDKITIFAETSGNCYTGTYSSSDEQFNAEITNEADAEETVFYAAYPNSYVSSDGKTYTNDKAWKFKQTTGVYVEAQKVLSSTVSAVKDGIDPGLTVMTAKTDENGTLSFVYGCAFFKVTITNENVQSLTFTTGTERLGGRPQYNENGEMVTVQSGVNSIVLAANGTLEKNGTYYIPFIPRNLDSSGNTQKIGAFTITIKLQNGASKSVSTEAIKNDTFVSGTIYNLGSPYVSFNPELSASALSIDASDNAGSIIYTLVNEVEGGVISASVDNTFEPEEGNDAISNFAIDATNITSNAVPFTCDINNGDNPRQAKVIITYTYNDTETVSEEVIVTQRVSGVSESHSHIFYIKDKAAHQETDGESGSYFNNIAGSLITSWSSDYSVQSATIDGSVYNEALKLDSSGSISFTTSATLSSSLTFYCVRRKSSDSATVNVLKNNNVEVDSVSPEHTSLTEKTVSLEKNTLYTIKQGTKESALFYVIVTEN